MRIYLPSIKSIKNYKLTLILFFSLIFSCYQAQKSSIIDTSFVYKENKLDVKSEFEGGRKELKNFLSSNLEYPQEAINNHVEGKVIIKFIVYPNGTIDNFETVKDIGYGCAEEIIRVLKKTQARWNPAKIGKDKVKSQYLIKITFKIPEGLAKPYIKQDI